MIETDDMTPEAATDLKAKRETAKQKDARVKAAYEAVMADPRGRTVIWDIIAKGGMFADPYMPGDNLATHINLGRAQLARQVYVEIGNAYPARLLEMETENMR